MNTFGQLFRLTDFGETHGAGLGGVIDGCPAGIVWDQSFIQSEVDRRSPFYNNFHGTTRAESDPIEFISGIYDNKTTGAPIGFVIPNHDVKPNIETNHLLKPSHSSFVYKEKYGHTCNEQGGRASARQTCCRVVGGAVAKLFLRDYHIEVQTKSISQAPLKSGDTSGAIVECVVHNMPSGIGEPVYGGLDAYLAAAMLSIPACKGIEFGAGFRAAQMNGSQYNDLQNSDFTFQTNHDGGIQAGISNGQPIVMRLAFKPIPSVQMMQKTIDYQGNSVDYCANDRNDSCVVPRVFPVVEAMAALVIADSILMQNARRFHS